MAEITAQMVKELRNRTQAGYVDCKQALVESGGDMEKAMDYLRTKGLATAAKKAGREASEGLVHAYIHGNGRIGVLIEVNCETDFVARTDEFVTLVRDLAMQVAAERPLYVRREDVPEDVIEREKAVFEAAAREEKKPDHVIERIVAGKLEAYFKQVCLEEQAFIKDPDRTVKEVLQGEIARIGENIQVRRFARFELGEGSGE